MSSTTGEFEFHPVTPARWADLAAFFAQHGNPNYCWCMRWRLRSSEFGKFTAQERRSRLASLVQDKTPIGILAYHEGRPAGWCSIAPRESYPALERSRVLPRLDERPTWSVVCFFVDPKVRGQGLAVQLLQAGVRYAAAQGAAVVEGYPVEPDQSYRFMGAPAVFTQAGFEEVAVGPSGRRIVRREVRTDG